MKRIAVLLGAVVALAAAGCGYVLAGRGSFLPSYVNAIGIPPFINRTSVFNLETQLTQKVQSEFIGRSRYQVLNDSTNADAVLTGEIVSVVAAPVSFSPGQIASRYTITMSARVELRDVRDNKVLWENPSLVFRQEHVIPEALVIPGRSSTFRIDSRRSTP